MMMYIKNFNSRPEENYFVFNSEQAICMQNISKIYREINIILF